MKDNLEKIKRLLVIVDMVNGFVRKGAMSDLYIEHIIPEQLRLIKEFLENDEGVMFIKDSHKEGCSEFTKFPVHCLESTFESELIKEFIPYEKDSLVYKKNSTSAIFANGFIDDISKMRALREVIVTGCCTDICVMNLAIPLQNLFDEENKKVDIIVPKNAVETYDAPNHNRDEYSDMAFKFMKQAGIKLVKKYERKI